MMWLLPEARETLHCIIRDIKSISMRFEVGGSQENFHITHIHTHNYSLVPRNRNQIFYIFLPSIAPSFPPSGQQRVELQLVNENFDIPDPGSKQGRDF